MKIRQDFITNSSSSSFIVAFPDKIYDLDQIKEYIYPDWKAEIVFRDCQSQNPEIVTSASQGFLDNLAEQIKDGYFESLDNDYYKDRKAFLEREGITLNELHEHWDWYNLFERERDVRRTKSAKEIAKTFAKENEGYYLYHFDYGDEDGDKMSEMEHGDTFVKVSHLTISHH